MRVRLIILQFKIFKAEIKYTSDFRVQYHLRQGIRFPGQLKFDLFNVVHVDMCIPQCMNKFTRFKSGGTGFQQWTPEEQKALRVKLLDYLTKAVRDMKE